MKAALLAKWPAAIGLTTGTLLTTRSLQTTFAADKPFHSAIVTLGVCGAVILGVNRVLPRESQTTEGKSGGYEAVPLRSFEEDGEDEINAVQEQTTYPSTSLRRLRICFLVLVLALCLRAEVLHRVLNNIQCSTRSWTPLLPLAFAVEEWWRVRRRRRRGGSRDLSHNDDEDASAYEALSNFVARMPISGVISVGMVCLGGMLALGATAAPRSTFICAATLPYRLQVPHLQVVGTILDVVLVWCVGQLLTLQQHGPAASRSLGGRAAGVGWAALLSSAILLVIGMVYYYAEEADRIWILQIAKEYVWSLLRLDSYIAFTLICGLALILHVGVLTTSILATFTSVLTITTVSAWNNAHPFPPSHLGLGTSAITMAILGFVIHSHLETTKSSSLFSRGIPIWLHLILLTIFLTWTTLFFTTSTTVSYHPIDMLIYQASARHEAFLQQAYTSKSLTRAVQVYKHRYNRHPPPNFDKWHAYATARNSLIIDDFDSIHNDLLPFYALEPSVIRERTWELISNPWNDAAGLSIRDGKVSVLDNGIPGTHAWMTEGLVEMIGRFSEHLPDMDLAFNLNDECRVAVPYENIESLKSAASAQLTGGVETPPMQTAFSRTAWKALPENRNEQTPLHEQSWQRTFATHGAPTCPPHSAARTHRIWDTSSLCTQCMSPHSLGAFLANWTLAGNICHQPDLADLHGIFLSPAAFKAARELYPFFSQSKVGGFNDILYPSAWNYLEKAHYGPTEEFGDVEWGEKGDVLFWRGATSEGVSQGWGQWRGMVRQRFVNLFAGNATTMASVGLLPVGQPVPANSTGKTVHNKLGYSVLETGGKQRKADVHVVDNIVRCAGKDCEDQANALAPLVEPINFQEHWRYRYLLDLDGAGFSGRFVPFLRSGSLPVKAGLFREWWDGRVEAWKHFVPVDVRGSGVEGTMLYFQDGGHERQGRRIAGEGKEWAGKVLRSEDMEVYMFRLLLEWGRVVDDEREGLGYRG